jgi:tetratricopeptide (TPR) repeat protein
MGQPGQTSLSERLRSIEAEIAAGQAESALAHCQDIFAQYPRALAVQRVLGEIYLALRKPREALGALDRALAGDPEDARACCARAIIHQMHGDPVAALAWYRRACDARPDDQTLRATYREMASRVGRPPYQPTRLGLARLYVRGALFTHAIREWETLIAENSDLLEAQVGLVETLWRVERTQEAEEWARRVLMNAPACVKPLLIVAVIARDTGRAPEAERYLQRATELDPDHRIARALFADRAMGDTALRALFWGDDPFAAASAASTPGGQRASYGSLRQTGPLFEAPTGAPLSGAASLTDLGAALSRPDLGANLSRPLAAPARPHNLPPEFHSMFKETENMLWGPDHSDPGARPTAAMPAPQRSPAAPAQPAQAPTQPPIQPGAPFMSSPAEPLAEPLATYTPPSQPMAAPQSGRLGQQPFDSSSQFVPPAIAESQFALGDTETRRAIRWVQWLQAQGARMRSDEVMRSRPTGSLDALFGGARQDSSSGTNPGASPSPFNGRGTQLPVTSLPSTGPTMLGTPPASGGLSSGGPSGPSLPRAGSSAPLSGPLLGAMPQPKPEELRQMFAQLEPAAQANDIHDIVDADVVDARNAPDRASFYDAPASAAPPPAETEGAWPEALADAFEWPSQPGAAEPGAQPGRQSMGNGHVAPDLTLEALEGAHSADGYQPFTLEPGALAAFAGDGQRDAAPAGETARALDEFFQGPEEPPAAAAEEAPARLAQAPISPTDYPARLAAARALRDEGALDEALVEYRALLKNAPDLLPDVLSDLESSLDEQPEHPELHRLLGDARIRQGDYMAALESLNRSVSLTQPGDE